jgi:hypothetical protein
MKIKFFSLLAGVLILQIISSFSQPGYSDSAQDASESYPVQLHAKTEGVILHDTLKIIWTSPANETTTLKSASAKIKATIKSSSGLS